jgi:uncharacterized membrane protein
MCDFFLLLILAERLSGRHKKRTAASKLLGGVGHSLRSSRGHVSNACLWHACRTVTLGAVLIITGIVLSVLGKVYSHETYKLLGGVGNSLRSSRGHVSNACLWHACRTVTLGAVLIITGIVLSVLGRVYSYTPMRRTVYRHRSRALRIPPWDMNATCIVFYAPLGHNLH